MTGALFRGASAREGTPERPRPAPPQATPSGDAATGSVFAQMLSLAPDVLAQPDHPVHLAQFGDVAVQLAAVGKEQPTSTEDPAFEGWPAATQWITMPTHLVRVALQPEMQEYLGFSYFQLDQGLVVGEPPNVTTFLRGRLNHDDLRAAWTNAGYRQLAVDGAAVFSIADGPELDFENPIQRIFLANVNNAMILADGTLVFAASLDLIRRVLAVSAGQAPPLAEHEQVAALLSSVDQPLASALLLDGESLASGMVLDPRMTAEQLKQMQEDLAQSGEMPPTRLALFGVTPGGPIPAPLDQPDATPTATDNPAIWVIRLLMASMASAETAAETIPNRIATLTSTVRRLPYAWMFTVRRSEALSDPPVVALELDFVMGEVLPAAWHQSIVQRDLLFLAS